MFQIFCLDLKHVNLCCNLNRILNYVQILNFGVENVEGAIFEN